MEESIFPDPAVAGVLQPGFVEARLHMDKEPSATRYAELRDELVGTLAMPSYVVYDPHTERSLAVHKGWMPHAGRFSAWLREAQAAR